jgi:hypothetical protein
MFLQSQPLEGTQESLWPGWGPGEDGQEEPIQHLHYCCHCHCHQGTPASAGRSGVGRGLGALRQRLGLGCVGLSPRHPQLLLSLEAGAGLLLRKW